MTRMTSAAYWFLFVLFSTPAYGQDERASDVHYRNECRLAAQVLQTGDPRPKREWALEAIRTCSSEIAVPALIASWGKASGDSVQLMKLYRATRHYRDARLYTTMRLLASTSDRPQLVRMAALAALAAQVDTRIGMSLGLLRPIAGIRGRWQRIWFWDSHGFHHSGGVPLPIGARGEVERISAELAAAPERDALSDVAAQLVRMLRSRA